MEKIAQFEKVSLGQFVADSSDELGTQGSYTAYSELKLPARATEGSAGYDFYAPYTFDLKPGESIKIPTGIRVKIDNGWFLMMCPRSGHGFKYYIRLANTVGIIDCDYCKSDNEGHIFVKLYNGSPEGKTLSVKQGEAYCQAIFLPFGITIDDEADGIRNGGFGSTTNT